MVDLIRRNRILSKPFPTVLYAYHLLDGDASIVIVDNLEDIPGSPPKAVAVYDFKAIGNLRRETKFDLLENKGE